MAKQSITKHFIPGQVDQGQGLPLPQEVQQLPSPGQGSRLPHQGQGQCRWMPAVQEKQLPILEDQQGLPILPEGNFNL